MKNNPVELLMNEHTTISSVESIIKSINNKWKINSENYLQDVKQILVFLREYSDNFHHFKEEKILFSELKNHKDFIYQEIIDELEQQHDMFRKNNAQITSLIEQKQYEETQALLENNMNDLLDHIAVENDELFGIAETLFNETELERIYFKFIDIDNETGVQNKQKLIDDIQTMLKN